MWQILVSFDFFYNKDLLRVPLVKFILLFAVKRTLISYPKSRTRFRHIQLNAHFVLPVGGASMETFAARMAFRLATILWPRSNNEKN